MEDFFEKLEEQRKKQIEEHEAVRNSPEYKQGLQYLNSILTDFIPALQYVSIYSTRGGDIYPEFMSIRMIDELIESVVGVRNLIQEGIHNPVRRELRYLIELTVKFVIVDYARMGASLTEKIQHLADEIPNSSIQIVDSFTPPFDDKWNQQFTAEIKDFFYKACAYVHPSRTQFENRLRDYRNGNFIGFESAASLTKINTLLFRALDMILVLVFHAFGPSMSGDLFIQIFDEDKDWKFHKGKYMAQYSHLFDYKHERKHRT